MAYVSRFQRKYLPARARQAASASSAAKDPFVNESDSITKRTADILAHGGQPEDTQVTRPAWFQQLLGPISALPAAMATTYYNGMDAATSGGTRAPGLSDFAQIPFRANPFTEPIAEAINGGGTEKRKSVLEEMGKAWRGERAPSTADAIKDFMAPAGARTGAKAMTNQETALGPLWWLTHPGAAVQNPNLQFAAGLTGDIATDPLTPIDFGASGAAKMGASTVAKDLIDNVLTPERVSWLVDAGLDATKHGPEIDALMRAGRGMGEASPALQKEIMPLLRRKVAKGLGEPMGVHAFGREIGNAQPLFDKLASGTKGLGRAIPGGKTLEKLFGREKGVVEAAQAGRPMNVASMKIGMREAAGIENAGTHAAMNAAVKFGTDVPDNVAAAIPDAMDAAKAPFEAARKPLLERLDAIGEEIKAARKMESAQKLVGMSTAGEAKAARNHTIEQLQLAYSDTQGKIRDLIDGDLRPNFSPRIRERLLAGGFDPADVEKAVKGVEEQITPFMDEALARSQAIDVPDTSLLGAGGLGYLPHLPAPERGPIETAWNKLLKRPDYTQEELARLGQKTEGLNQPPQSSMYSYGASAKPRQPVATPRIPTFAERNAKNLSTELRPGVLIAEKGKAVSHQEAAAHIEDNFLRNFEATPPDGLTAATREKWLAENGLVDHAIVRNGQARQAAVPALYEEAFQNSTKPLFSSPAMADFVRSYSKVLSVWKRMATTLNPGFHGRNLGSNLLLLNTEGIGQAAGVVDGMDLVRREIAGKLDPNRMIDAGALGRIPETEYMAWAREQALRTGGYSRGQAEKVLSTELRQNVGRATRKGKVLEKFNYGRHAENLGEVVEDGMRLGGNLNALRKGLDPTSSVDLAVRAMYDYSATATNQVEKGIVQNLIPFWKWQKANAPHIAEWALKNPGKANILTHLRNTGAAVTGVDLSTMPDYAKEGGYIPLPGADGQALMVNPNVPMQDLGRLPHDPASLYQWVMQGLTPIVKAPLEMGFNKSSFTGLPIEQQGRKTPVNGIIQGVHDLIGNNPVGRFVENRAGMQEQIDPDTGQPYLAGNAYVNYAMQALSPIAANVGKVVDSKTLDRGFKALSWGTGLKLAPVRKEQSALAALKARDQELADQQAQMRDELNPATGQPYLPQTKAQITRRKNAARFTTPR